MARPNRQTFTATPIQSFSAYDKVFQVQRVLRELEMGSFREAAILSDAFGRDDRIDGVLRTRIDALLGADLDVKAADKRPRLHVTRSSWVGPRRALGGGSRCSRPG